MPAACCILPLVGHAAALAAILSVTIAVRDAMQADQMGDAGDDLLISTLLAMASTHAFLPLVLVHGGFMDEIVAWAGQVRARSRR